MRQGLTKLTLRCAAAIIVLWPALLATAQEEYRLDDQGQWEQLTSFDPATPEGQLQAIRKAIAEEHGGKAVKLASRWIERYPNHPLLVEAHLLRGDARVLENDFFDALFDYEWVIRMYPASEQFITALEREFKVAEIFAGGKRRKLLGMRLITAYGEAEEIFIRIQERLPGSDLGERASIRLGDFYFDRGEMERAAEAYDLFLDNYPRSRRREWAMLRLIQASLARFKGPNFDSTGLIDAQERIRQYKSEFPAAAERIGADALTNRIADSLALKLFNTARWYEGQGEKVSAVHVYRRLIRDYPQTGAAQDALARLEAMDERVAEAPQRATPADEVDEQADEQEAAS